MRGVLDRRSLMRCLRAVKTGSQRNIKRFLEKFSREIPSFWCFMDYYFFGFYASFRKSRY
jgi:hypothetical protein